LKIIGKIINLNIITKYVSLLPRLNPLLPIHIPMEKRATGEAEDAIRSKDLKIKLLIGISTKLKDSPITVAIIRGDLSVLYDNFPSIMVVKMGNMLK